MHQLRLIVKLLGKPDPKDLNCISSREARDAIDRFTYPGTVRAQNFQDECLAVSDAYPHCLLGLFFVVPVNETGCGRLAEENASL